MALVGGVETRRHVAEIFLHHARRTGRVAFAAFETSRDIGERLLDALQAAIERLIGLAAFRDLMFEARHGAGGLRFAGGDARGELVECIAQLMDGGGLTLQLRLIVGACVAGRSFHARDGAIELVGEGL